MRKLLIPSMLAVTLLAALALVPGAPLPAQDTGFDIEGKYKPIQPPRRLEESDKVEVVDVFWYGCPHCFRFLPFMQDWEHRAPDYVEVRRVPAIFRKSWTAHARAYYTARLLGVDDELHVPLFKAIHNGGKTLDTRQALADFFAAHGVDKDTFGKTYDSFTVDSLTRQSEVMVRRWGVRGTPSVIVNGRYLVSGSTAGTFGNAIKVIEALVEREHEAMAERKQQGG